MLFEEWGVPCGTIENYIKLLYEWNEKINLVSFATRKELINRHIIDSLQLSKYINKNEVVFDIGSGAGFPGLMLSYAGVREVHLVEKIEKKANFLFVAGCLSLDKVCIHNCNASEIDAEKCDVIVARGLAALDVIFSSTYNLNKKDTRYLLLKGQNIANEIKNALVKWSFNYIMHPSISSEEGCVLELTHLKLND